MTKKWIAGWNMAGYLPESEPAEFDNPSDAARYIVDSMRSHAAEAEYNEDTKDEIANLEAAAKTIEAKITELRTDLSYTVNGWCYFVTSEVK